MMLPKTIRIGGTDYTIVEKQDLRDGSTDLNGHILYNDCEIRIESEMNPHVKWVTVWHEVIHGILVHAGLGEHEENLVTALGYGVAQVLRDNPFLREERNDNEATSIPNEL
jgi:hypothetical protein